MYSVMVAAASWAQGDPHDAGDEFDDEMSGMSPVGEVWTIVSVPGHCVGRGQPTVAVSPIGSQPGVRG